MKLFYSTLTAIILLSSCSSIETESDKNNDNPKPNERETTMNLKAGDIIYAYEYESPSGERKSMKQFKEKVVLIINTATQCGLTPQFEGLEKLHTTYEHKGLKVIGFPCNQFGGQEPLSDSEMVETCKLNHGVTFELAKKIEVNGKGEHPIYTFLKNSVPLEGDNEIRWNFEKFLINRQGEIVKRYAPKVTPAEITLDIENLL